MSTLDQGLMPTLTQQERDAMDEDDTTTESVDHRASKRAVGWS